MLGVAFTKAGNESKLDAVVVWLTEESFDCLESKTTTTVINKMMMTPTVVNLTDLDFNLVPPDYQCIVMVSAYQKELMLATC